MARERSEKSKNKPVDGKERMRTGKPDERASTRADLSGEVISGNPTRHNSSQPAARSKKRQEQQRIEIEQEPSADLRESQKVLEEGSLNGGQSIEDDWSTHRRIAEKAFILFQESGYEHGNDWSHWFEAERADKRNS
ncbi:MAG: DUF2934 domain-containing protein [Nitrospira sp.]|nr:DUF2934 domain-containing protein [Nitrospira sp.]